MDYKKIIKKEENRLSKNWNTIQNIAYKFNTKCSFAWLGNPLYFNDDFKVLCYQVLFDYLENDYNSIQKQKNDFIKAIRKNGKFEIIDRTNIYTKSYYFLLVEKSDFIAYQNHAKRIKVSQDNFNNWLHYFYKKYGCENVTA